MNDPYIKIVVGGGPTSGTPGPAGADGATVTAITSDPAGLTFELSDGTTVGPVALPAGSGSGGSGPALSNVTADASGLTFHLDDGTTIGPVALPAGSGGGSGTVTSVNSDTGPDVVLDADAIAPTATRLWLDPADLATVQSVPGLAASVTGLQGDQLATDATVATNTGNIASVINRTVDTEERWNNLFDATEEAFNPATDYGVDDVVMHAGTFWIATADPAVGSEPGQAPNDWAVLTMESLFKKIGARSGGTAVPAVQAGELRGSIGSTGELRVDFPTPFSKIPVVVADARIAGGGDKPYTGHAAIIQPDYFLWQSFIDGAAPAQGGTLTLNWIATEPTT